MADIWVSVRPMERITAPSWCTFSWIKAFGACHCFPPRCRISLYPSK